MSWKLLRELEESYGLVLNKNVNNVQIYRLDFLKHAVYMNFH